MCRAVDPWPGWGPGAAPALISLEPEGSLLLGVPEPPPGFGRLDLADGLAALYRPGLVETQRLANGVLAGRYQVAAWSGRVIPAVSFSPARDAVTSMGMLVRELFRVTAALDLAGSVAATAGTGEEDELSEVAAPSAGADDFAEGALPRRAAFLRQLQAAYERYPEMQLLNNVLGNLEGRLLYGHLNGSGFGEEAVGVTGQSQPAATARALALVRRERHADMGPSTIGYERRMELFEGLPRFVELALLRAMCGGDGPPVLAEFEAIAGEDYRETARRLVAARFGMLTQLNVRGWGASRRRFYHSGAAIAFLLDDVVPGWRREVALEGRPLDLVLEAVADFDGGPVDEKLLETTRRYYGYYERLQDEQQWSRDTADRRRELLAGVFSGAGTKVTLDVSALNAKSAWYDTATAERLGESVIVHVRPGVFTYGDGGTFVECRGLSMVEDRRARLFHVTVPGTKLAIMGDEESVGGARGAEFTEGLNVELGGLRVRARRGVLRRAGDTLYIRVLA
jgi:hypothetical protein